MIFVCYHALALKVAEVQTKKVKEKFVETTNVKTFMSPKSLGFIIYCRESTFYRGAVGPHILTSSEEIVAVLADGDILMYTAPPTVDNPGHSDKIPSEFIEKLRTKVNSGTRGPLCNKTFTIDKNTQLTRKYKETQEKFLTLRAGDEIARQNKRGKTSPVCKLSPGTQLALGSYLHTACSYLQVLDPGKNPDRFTSEKMMVAFKTISETTNMESFDQLTFRYRELLKLHSYFLAHTPDMVNKFSFK